MSARMINNQAALRFFFFSQHCQIEISHLPRLGMTRGNSIFASFHQKFNFLKIKVDEGDTASEPGRLPFFAFPKIKLFVGCRRRVVFLIDSYQFPRLSAWLCQFWRSRSYRWIAGTQYASHCDTSPSRDAQFFRLWWFGRQPSSSTCRSFSFCTHNERCFGLILTCLRNVWRHGVHRTRRPTTSSKLSFYTRESSRDETTLKFKAWRVYKSLPPQTSIVPDDNRLLPDCARPMALWHNSRTHQH